MYLITGVNGQDGFFSARHFLKRNRSVIGVSRHSASHPTIKLLSHYPNFTHVSIDEYTSKIIDRIISEVRPDRILHCAGFADIPKKPDGVKQCFFTNCDILEMLLNAVSKCVPESRLLFISSAEIFDKTIDTPLDEDSPISPDNEYGVSKVQGMQIIDHFRSEKNRFAVSGICFNHDSFLSPTEHLVKLVPRKILDVEYGITSHASFFNVDIHRDWSHASDFVDAFDRMLENNVPEDFVVASGISTKLRDYISLTADLIGFDNKGVLKFESDERKHIYNRISNPSKLKEKLNWVPQYDVPKLCKEMIWWERRSYNTNRLNKFIKLPL